MIIMNGIILPIRYYCSYYNYNGVLLFSQVIGESTGLIEKKYIEKIKEKIRNLNYRKIYIALYNEEKNKYKLISVY